MKLGLLLLVPFLLCAQPPRGPRPWWNKEVAQQLNLTDTQTRQMNQIHSDFRQKMSAARDEVNKAEAVVDAAFNEDPVDEAKAGDAINRLAAARGELTKADSQMYLKLRMILTPQQWQQLQQSQRGGPGRPGPRRRGPPKASTPTPNGSNQQK